MTINKKIEIRREQVLKVAEEIFAQKGFHETTISDVAKKAGFSEGTIYEYFTSKEDLLFSIPGETTRAGAKELERHLEYARGATNKIRSIIYHFLSFYQNNRAYASVAMLILKPNRRFLKTKDYQVVREGYRMILKVIEEGIASGEFIPELNPYLARSVILGTIEHMVTGLVLLGRPKNLLELVDPLTDIVLRGIQNKEVKQWDIAITLVPEEGKKVSQTLASARKNMNSPIKHKEQKLH